MRNSRLRSSAAAAARAVRGQAANGGGGGGNRTRVRKRPPERAYMLSPFNDLDRGLETDKPYAIQLD